MSRHCPRFPKNAYYAESVCVSSKKARIEWRLKIFYPYDPGGKMSEFFLKFYLNLLAFWTRFQRDGKVIQIISKKKNSQQFRKNAKFSLN